MEEELDDIITRTILSSASSLALYPGIEGFDIEVIDASKEGDNVIGRVSGTFFDEALYWEGMELDAADSVGGDTLCAIRELSKWREKADFMGFASIYIERAKFDAEHRGRGLFKLIFEEMLAGPITADAIALIPGHTDDKAGQIALTRHFTAMGFEETENRVLVASAGAVESHFNIRM